MFDFQFLSVIGIKYALFINKKKIHSFSIYHYYILVGKDLNCLLLNIEDEDKLRLSSLSN